MIFSICMLLYRKTVNISLDIGSREYFTSRLISVDNRLFGFYSSNEST